MPTLNELMAQFYQSQLGVEGSHSLTDLQYAFFSGVASGDIVVGGAGGTLPLDNIRLEIYATAANTWPTRASQVPSGFNGRVTWDHSEFGATDIPPATIAAKDIMTDREPL